jgi:hypothetical protein
MTPDAVALFATVILLLPMGYFLLAAPAFLLVKLDIPPVALLLRGMFNAYFLALAIASVIGTVAFAVAGRPAFAIGIGLIAASRSRHAAGFCGRWMPSLVPGMPAMPMRRAGCVGCIGAGCCAMRSSLSLSWAAFLISRSRQFNQA